MSAALHAENLTVKLRETNAGIVSGVSFSLCAGGALALVGDSGSGKTMCVNAILGLLNKRIFNTSGIARFAGENLLTMPEHALRRIRGDKIALIPQNPMTAFDPGFKIGTQITETIRAHRRLTRRAARTLSSDALDALGLPDSLTRSYPHTLSGGMLQRAAIALALIMEPEIVIADEATTALDVVNRRIVLDELIKLKSRGSALLLITHNPREAEYCSCETIYIGERKNED
ncbi:MAG: ATP-binding cassette domain-containing protein [Oscillospiraceae bacterium]|jgi:ABC-type dipeptide/oligopeptide/nickel transport system ATPase component|nr:ATP-binding cassette domain-containing protein [Oscillospiraceae bacterium]